MIIVLFCLYHHLIIVFLFHTSVYKTDTKWGWPLTYSGR